MWDLILTILSAAFAGLFVGILFWGIVTVFTLIISIFGFEASFERKKIATKAARVGFVVGALVVIIIKIAF